MPFFKFVHGNPPSPQLSRYTGTRCAHKSFKICFFGQCHRLAVSMERTFSLIGHTQAPNCCTMSCDSLCHLVAICAPPPPCPAQVSSPDLVSFRLRHQFPQHICLDGPPLAGRSPCYGVRLEQQSALWLQKLFFFVIAAARVD